MAKKAKGVGAYTTNNAGLTRKDWTMNGTQGKNGDSVDILDNVEKNANEDEGFSGAIRYGTNRKAGM